MTQDKIKQYIGFFGGFLGALYMLLKQYGIQADYIDPDKQNAIVAFLDTVVPFLMVSYGVWKNTYIATSKARKQEKVLQDAGLKPSDGPELYGGGRNE